MSKIEKTNLNNVINVTVKNDVCIGCGMCAGICPHRALEMRWSQYGELIPNAISACTPNCEMCLKCCPFCDQDTDQDQIAKEIFGGTTDIRRTQETGYYMACYAGYSLRNDQRRKGTSGGMVTWFLETLLERKLVDGVVCVVPDKTSGADRLFRYAILRDIKDIRDAAKSKYYPVEISEVIRTILAEKEEQKYAIVGLPCLIYALNLATQRIPKLRRRVVFKLALVCGQLPNRFYTECLALESGIAVNTLQTVDYRIKEKTRRAGNYLFQAYNTQGIAGQSIYWIALPSYLWHNSFFIHNACNYCDDVYGETADVSFMDAWLPEHESDPQGHTLIIARTPDAKNLLEIGIRKKSCNLKPITIDKVIQSQAGGIRKKRHIIKGKLFRAEKFNKWVPPKRIKAEAKVYYRHFLSLNLNDRIMIESKRQWTKYRMDPDTTRFWRAMKPWVIYIKIYRRAKRILNITRKLFHSLKGEK